MKHYTHMGLAAGLAFTMVVLFGPLAEAVSVSGTINVVGTIVKTEGGKSAKDVIVYLEKRDGASYPAPSKEHATIDQVGSVFIPHVLPIQRGVTVDFINSDTFEHNVFSADDCCKFNLGNFPGGTRGSHTFEAAGEAVMLCNLHPEMAAYVVVLDTPYFTTAEIDGETQSATYTIENVLPGEYILKVWNKKTEAPGQEITAVEGEDLQANIELQRKQRKKRNRK